MIHGIVNIYKEKGYTSHDVVARLRTILGQKKIGHTGTLDPDAEGVLPVCLGKGTKLCDMLTDKEKTYQAVLLLGCVTDTQDAGGEILRTAPITCTEEEARAAILHFVGTYQQIPPMYSALKIDGKKLCDLARAGKTVERKSRPVTITEILIDEMSLPRVKFTVTCSRGTYIRTLCEDIGERLGCGGCMESLLRTRVGKFELRDSLRIDEVRQAAEDGSILRYVTPIDSMFLSCPAVSVKAEYRTGIENGNAVTQEMLTEPLPALADGRVRLYDSEGVFFAVYGWNEDRQRFEPVKMFYEREDAR